MLMPVEEQLLGGNRLLRALPAPLQADVARLATGKRFSHRESLYEQGETIDEVVFPLTGVFSLVLVMEDGRAVEVATVGNEGFVGLPVFLQATLTSAHRAFAQIPGDAVVMEPAAFMQLTNAGGPFQTALQRYAQALITLIAQGSACNRLHKIDQRCARWLLETHDRVDDDDFPLTQDFLAKMLGVGRHAVNEAAQALQDAGLIRYSRGRVAILDRSGLEDAACECYAIVREEFDRLLPG
jgi:CRP-like cAMP-binding protein